MTCENCIRLTRELREALETIEEYERPEQSITPEIHKIRKWLGRPARIQTARMLDALMKTPGQIVTNERLAFAMEYDGDLPIFKILSVHSTYLRNALERRGLPRSVRTGYGSGRWIDPENAAIIAAEIEAFNGS